MRLICALLVFGLAVPSNADDRSELEQRAKFLWAGFKENRDRLEKGVFRAHGRVTHVDPDGSKRDGPEEIFSAFDYRQGLLRFDREDPFLGKVTLPPGKKMPAIRGEGGKYARNRKTSEVWLLDAQWSTTHPVDQTPPTVIRPFDPRGVGLYDWAAIAATINSADEQFEYFSKKVPDSIEVKDEVYHLTYLLKAANVMPMKLEIWLDGNRGFSPIRRERRFRYGGSPASPWSEPDGVSESSWKKVNGVWVAESWKIDTRDKAGKVRRSVELAFEWEAVNQRIDERLFTKEGFNLPKGTYLIDMQLGKPIATEVVGGGPTYVIPEQSAPPSPPRRRGWLWATGVCVPLAAMLGWVAYRRLGRSRRDGQ